MLSIIVAISQNNIIGDKNKLIWHLSEDLKRFKSITSNKTIIMGRKTFQSLKKMLPNRKHIVISNSNFESTDENLIYSDNLNDIIEKYKNVEEEVFIIGGAKIYNQTLKHCKKLYVTKIFKDYEGDSSFEIDYTDFDLSFESEFFIDEKANVNFKYFDYIKR